MAAVMTRITALGPLDILLILLSHTLLADPLVCSWASGTKAVAFPMTGCGVDLWLEPSTLVLAGWSWQQQQQQQPVARAAVPAGRSRYARLYVGWEGGQALANVWTC
jgi:hypothetical protein